MGTIICDANNEINVDIIQSLPTNQGGVGRHKCPCCAYNEGLKDGELQFQYLYDERSIEICKHGSYAPIEKIINIHENQKNTQGRHKCLICAYEIGFNQGLKKLKKKIKLDKVILGQLLNKDEKLPEKKISITDKKKVSCNKPKSKINFLEEQRFRNELGLLGEKLVCKYEFEQGFNVEHKSLKDDSLGYDILSKNSKFEKFIEVKTTIGDLSREFYLSKNELDFFKRNKNTYIYRVYNYNFSTHSADLKILEYKDLITKFNMECQSYIITIGK